MNFKIGDRVYALISKQVSSTFDPINQPFTESYDGYIWAGEEFSVIDSFEDWIRISNFIQNCYWVNAIDYSKHGIIQTIQVNNMITDYNWNSGWQITYHFSDGYWK